MLDNNTNNTKCGGWYSTLDGGDNPKHWGQTGLNRVGLGTANVAAAHRNGAPSITWDLGIEVAQPGEYDPPEAYPPILLKVYKSNGAEITGLPNGGVIPPTLSNPDWKADFDVAVNQDATWDVSWDDLDTDFLTFELIQDIPSPGTDVVLRRYVYVPTDIAYTVGVENFYRPEAATVPASARFEVYRDGSGQPGVRAKSGFTSEFFEEAFGDDGDYVIPYNHDHYTATCEVNCPADPDALPGYFLAPFPVTGNAPTTTTQRYTFADEADVVLPSEWETVSWDVPDLLLQFPAGRRLVAEGVLNATDVKLTAANATTGWLGVRFEEGSVGTLDGVTVERVVSLQVDLPGDAAVEVYDADVTFNGSEILNGEDVHGVWASGYGTLVILNGSLVQGMEGDGVGVVAAAGAKAHVYDNTTIRLNDSGGVAATGTGSLLYLFESFLQGNGGYGVVSQASGAVVFGREGVTETAAAVEVSDSDLGGLYALSGGDIKAGLFNDNTGQCTEGCENSILNHFDNQPGGLFDAKSLGTGSLIYAEYDTWGGRGAGQLELEGNTNNIDVTPVWVPGAPRQGGTALAARQAGASAALRGGTGGALPEGTLPDSSAVVALVDAAYTSAALGDSAAATAALLQALPLAETEAEHGLAFGTAARFLAQGGDPALEEPLAAAAGPEDDARPWALAGLMASDAAEGRTADAWARADTLAAEYAGTDHALVGLGMAARLAAEAGDLAAAQAALAALEAGWPEELETEAAAALVRRLEEQLGAGGSGRSAGPGVPALAVAAVSAADAPSAFRLLGARPNPFTGRTAVPFEVAEPSRVRLAVYDVLGREVALLADGAYAAGHYEAAFEGHGLAAGLYLVQARVESGAEARRSNVVRITLVR
jgi:hypothetical protein